MDSIILDSFTDHKKIDAFEIKIENMEKEKTPPKEEIKAVEQPKIVNYHELFCFVPKGRLN